MELLEAVHILGNSYRLGSSGVSSSVVYGRFTFDFRRAFAAGTVCNLASRRSVLQALRNVLTRNATPPSVCAIGARKGALQARATLRVCSLRIVGLAPGRGSEGLMSDERVKRLKRQYIGSAERLQRGRGAVPVVNDRGAVAPAAITNSCCVRSYTQLAE
jgi:hypothetical protein